mmetsp:Transcript_5827/g.14192  ORF Transcript_5827/g.14192 Transcript_5827/m.14192 type:complete len:390 (-) Transcript_5827:2690-3859(-)
MEQGRRAQAAAGCRRVPSDPPGHPRGRPGRRRGRALRREPHDLRAAERAKEDRPPGGSHAPYSQAQARAPAHRRGPRLPRHPQGHPPRERRRRRGGPRRGSRFQALIPLPNGLQRESRRHRLRPRPREHRVQRDAPPLVLLWQRRLRPGPPHGAACAPRRAELVRRRDSGGDGDRRRGGAGGRCRGGPGGGAELAGADRLDVRDAVPAAVLQGSRRRVQGADAAASAGARGPAADAAGVPEERQVSRVDPDDVDRGGHPGEPRGAQHGVLLRGRRDLLLRGVPPHEGPLPPQGRPRVDRELCAHGRRGQGRAGPVVGPRAQGAGGAAGARGDAGGARGEVFGRRGPVQAAQGRRRDGRGDRGDQGVRGRVRSRGYRAAAGEAHEVCRVV